MKSFVQGDQILRPENTFIVIETCSGVRTVLTLTMLTVLLIDLFERRGRHAACLLLLAPIVAFLTNGLRVVTLVLNPHSQIHSIHNLQGIAMLLVGLIAMFLIDSLLERWPAMEAAADGSHDDALRRSRESSSDLGAFARSWGPAAVAVAAMLIARAAIAPWSAPTGLSETPSALLDRVYGENTGQEIAPDFQFRGSVRFLAHTHRRVPVAGDPVEVFLGVANETIRKHTALSPRLAWPASGYERISTGFDEFAEGLQVTRSVLRRGGRRVLSYSGYLRQGSLAGEWLRHAVALDRSPWVRRDHVLAFRISSVIDRKGGTFDETGAERRIRAAWARLAPELADFAPMQSEHAPDA